MLTHGERIDSNEARLSLLENIPPQHPTTARTKSSAGPARRCAGSCPPSWRTCSRTWLAATEAS